MNGGIPVSIKILCRGENTDISLYPSFSDLPLHNCCRYITIQSVHATVYFGMEATRIRRALRVANRLLCR
uniref:Uncharacterized protein n=1 Tax=mine drainage metagenome TaxID=410659 RepID=E6QUZ4_9ZZZZ